jgi:uncharacterized membrane protein YdfJ with MMPL/SSD domain
VFGTSDIIAVKTLGCGAALAVLVDSLLVRCLLLPSSLSLLGPQAWRLPSRLAWLHRRIGLREGDEPAPRLDMLPASGGGVW